MSIIRPHQSRRCSMLRGRLRKRPPELADGYDHTIDKRPPELADGYDRITDPGVVIKETERSIQEHLERIENMEQQLKLKSQLQMCREDVNVGDLLVEAEQLKVDLLREQASLRGSR